VIDTSFKCMQEIEDSTLQMEDSYTKMKHERMQGFAALQVCERRLQVREKRPASETFHDALQEALNCEKRTLEGFRTQLFDAEAGCKKLIDEMRSMRRFLSQDTGERRLEMAQDISSLRPQVSSVKKEEAEAPQEEAIAIEDQQQQQPSPPAQEVKAGKGAKETKETKDAKKEGDAKGEGEGAPAVKEGERPDSKTLTETTLAMLARAREIRAKSFQLVDKSRADCTRALNRTEEALQKRCIDLNAKSKVLVAHQLDVEAAISSAERSLERLAKRIDPKDKAKLDKHASDMVALESLRESKRALQEEIRSKLVALDVDNLCRRVTPAKADSAKNEAKRMASLQKSSSSLSLTGSRNKNLSSSPLSAKSNKFGDTVDAESTMAGSTRAPSSSAKPPSPAGGSSILRGASGLQ